MASFKFDLVSPERLLVSEDVESVIIPATEGEMTVLPNHAPVMTTIKPGLVTLKTASGETHKYVVFGGFADIVQSGCTLLAESATSADDITPDDLQKRINMLMQNDINLKQNIATTLNTTQTIESLTE